MEKIYLVIQESNVDGEIYINVVPCSSLEVAQKVMTEEKNTILNESPHYKDYKDCPEDYEIEETETHIYIDSLYDDYYENIYIQEKEILIEY
jgi:hypothetical protein